MNQQRSEFQYEQPVPQNRSTNTDPREKNTWQGMPNQEMNYAGAGPLGGQKIYPRPPRRRRRGLWIGLAVVLLILALMGGAVGSIFAPIKTTTMAGQSLQVSGAPTVIINDPTGSVKIHSGNSSSVTLDAAVHGGLFSNPSMDAVKMSENADKTVVTITITEDGSILNQGGVDLNITLPENSAIQANVNVGTLDINGVSGRMNLNMNVGTLNYENGTITDGSTFRNNTGTINFNGSIDPNGNYDFQDNTGTINLGLPGNVSFTLNASTSTGSVNNKFNTTNVGPGPYNAHITAHTDTGSVNIRPK